MAQSVRVLFLVSVLEKLPTTQAGSSVVADFARYELTTFSRTGGHGACGSTTPRQERSSNVGKRGGVLSALPSLMIE